MEPVEELRKVAYASGLNQEELIQGDANSLQFEDNTFDLICSFGVLHHVETPKTVIAEMLRCASIGIFISDSNTLGQGIFLKKALKKLMFKLGLWKLLQFVLTKGKMYRFSEGDGLFYSYSLYFDIDLIRKKATNMHVLNTGSENNPNETIACFAQLE